LPVHTRDLASEGTPRLKPTLQDGLEQRSQPHVVAGSDEVDRAAVHRTAHGAPGFDQAGQLFVLESLEPRPQADVGKIWHLSLHGHQALNGRGSRELDPVKQKLAREQGAIQRAQAEDLGAAGHRPILAAQP